MVNIVPVDSERHAGKGWRPPQGYAFAATQAMVPLVGLEFAKVAVAMPIAFIEHSGRYLSVAVMSPVAGRNFLVGPNGQWLGGYVPAVLRSYPFRLARVEGSDQVTLCIDEDSGLLLATEADAAKFFEQDGSPSASLKAVMEFLQQIEQSRLKADLAVAALAEARVIEPWSLTVTIGNQKLAANGLRRINEAALNGLDGETFLKIRSALALAYAQLLSTQTVGLFDSLATIQQQLMQKPHPLPNLASMFTTDDDGVIEFR